VADVTQLQPQPGDQRQGQDAEEKQGEVLGHGWMSGKL
jgi:hypothetical protein